MAEAPAERLPLLCKVTEQRQSRMYKVFPRNLSAEGATVDSEQNPEIDSRVELYLQYPKFAKGKKLIGVVRAVSENPRGFQIEWLSAENDPAAYEDLKKLIPAVQNQQALAAGELLEELTEEVAPDPSVTPPPTTRANAPTLVNKESPANSKVQFQLLLVTDDQQLAGIAARAAGMLQDKTKQAISTTHFNSAFAASSLEAAVADLAVIDESLTGVKATQIILWLRDREDAAHIPIAVVVNEESSVKIYQQAGADFFLSRPVRFNELLVTLEAMLP